MSENAEAIRKVILEQIVPELRSVGRASSPRPIVRVEAYIPETDPLRWLEAQTAQSKIYWSDREQAFSVAGIGVARVMRGDGEPDYRRIFAQMKRDLSHSYPNLRYYGGFRFDPQSQVQERWQPFGAYRFVIPQIEVGRKGNRTYLAVNIVANTDGAAVPHAEQIIRHVAALEFPEPTADAPLAYPIDRSDRPDQRQWTDLVTSVLTRIKSGVLLKLVLARQTEYVFEEPVSALNLLRRVVPGTKFSFHFCFQLDEHTAFLGASPERLYKRQNTYLQSEALAGTRTRGRTPEQDAALGAELLSSEKELREHRYVATHIRSVFEKHCRAVRGGDSVELLILRHCQHLLCRFEGMLTGGEADATIFAALHPTPAVGGVPTPAALEILRKMEPFDRGWYAAPVGWVGYDGSEFAVAIRSGLVNDKTLTLFSGAGIIDGSTPAEEWDEVENKLRNFTNTVEEEHAIATPPGIPS